MRLPQECLPVQAAKTAGSDKHPKPPPERRTGCDLPLCAQACINTPFGQVCHCVLELPFCP